MMNLFLLHITRIITERCIVIRIYCPLFLAGKVKGSIADFDVMTA